MNCTIHAISIPSYRFEVNFGERAKKIISRHRMTSRPLVWFLNVPKGRNGHPLKAGHLGDSFFVMALSAMTNKNLSRLKWVAITRKAFQRAIDVLWHGCVL